MSTEIGHEVFLGIVEKWRTDDDLFFAFGYDPLAILSVIESHPARVFAIDSFQHIVFNQLIDGDTLIKLIKEMCTKHRKVVIIVSHENRRDEIGMSRISKYTSLAQLSTKVLRLYRLSEKIEYRWEKDNYEGLF
jgi:hypothetical protein